jgi:hypothetical protein
MQAPHGPPEPVYAHSPPVIAVKRVLQLARRAHVAVQQLFVLKDLNNLIDALEHVEKGILQLVGNCNSEYLKVIEEMRHRALDWDIANNQNELVVLAQTLEVLLKSNFCPAQNNIPSPPPLQSFTHQAFILQPDYWALVLHIAQARRLHELQEAGEGVAAALMNRVEALLIDPEAALDFVWGISLAVLQHASREEHTMLSDIIGSSLPLQYVCRDSSQSTFWVGPFQSDSHVRIDGMETTLKGQPSNIACHTNLNYQKPSEFIMHTTPHLNKQAHGSPESQLKMVTDHTSARTRGNIASPPHTSREMRLRESQQLARDVMSNDPTNSGVRSPPPSPNTKTGIWATPTKTDRVKEEREPESQFASAANGPGLFPSGPSFESARMATTKVSCM